MGKEMATDVLVSVMAHLYEQVFVLDGQAICGQVVHEGEWMQLENFNTWCEGNLIRCYEGDDSALFMQKIASETIAEVLRTEDEYAIEFSVEEGEEEHRKCMRAFTYADDSICVCIKDVTKEYKEARSREQVVGESLSVAQQALISAERFLKDMKEDIHRPVKQAVEMLEVSLQKEQQDAKAYVEGAVEVLERYENEIDSLFALSAMEKGEEFKDEDVIFTADFARNLKQMACLQTGEQMPDIIVVNPEKGGGAFISDKRRLTLLLANTLTVMVSESRGENLCASMDIAVERTEDEEEIRKLVFGVSAKCAQESFLQGSAIRFAQRFAEHMSGELIAEAEEDDVKITISVPVQYADQEQRRKAKMAARLMDSINERGFDAYRALVVDDEVVSRGIVCSKLQQFGLNVETASDGEEAMEKLLASPGRYYHMLFTKMSLPKKSGLDLTMELREHIRRDLNDITIVTVTSNPMRDERLVALEHGMDYHIVLPFNDIELKEILLRELENLGPEEAHEKFGFRIIK